MEERTMIDLDFNIANFHLITNQPPPAGYVLMHNHVHHTPRTRMGTNGFRAWWVPADDPSLVVCECGWRPDLGVHFKVRMPTTWTIQ
jgi:hypothetical protein